MVGKYIEYVQALAIVQKPLDITVSAIIINSSLFFIKYDYNIFHVENSARALMPSGIE